MFKPNFSRTHTVGACNEHHVWSAKIPPCLRVAPGDTVTFETGLGAGKRFSPHSTSCDVLGKAPCPPGLALTGPVFVEGAKPGDALDVEIMDVTTGDWGYTVIEPGFGLLKEDFSEPVFRAWDLSNKRTARFSDSIEIPIEPFLGAIGVAPPPPNVYDSIPPTRWGGNIDTRQLTAGAILWLPIAVEGALLSVGDAHAAQGDGEVCGAAIETMARATLRLTISQGLNLTAPEFRTARRDAGRPDSSYWHATMGVGPDLMEAAKDAVRAMIRYLERSWSLSAEDAYILCSVCVDLKITEIVDAPNWIVSAFLPTGIFSAVSP